MTQVKKRSPSAYNFLVKDQELRQTIKEQHPDWKHPQVMAEFSRLWKSYTPEEKQPYLDQAARAKAEFLPTPPVSDESASDSEPESKQVPKKARTAWFCYLYDEEIREETKVEVWGSCYPEIKVTDLTKEISKKWKALDEAGQAPWKEMSEKEKQELLENPIYVTKKSKKKSSKKTKKDKTTTSTTSIDLDRLSTLEKSNQDLMVKVAELTALVQQLRADQA